MAPSPKPPSGGKGTKKDFDELLGGTGQVVRGWGGGIFSGKGSGKWGQPASTSISGYRKGVELDPLNWAPGEVYQLQQALQAVGLLPTFAAYDWDAKSQNAFELALIEANKRGITVEEYLSMRMAGMELAGEGPGGLNGAGAKMGDYQLPVINVDNPDDLRDIFQQVSIATIGHSVSDEELGSMVLAYTGMQIERQKQGLAFAQQEREAQLAGQMGFGEPVVVEGEQDPEGWSRKWFKGAHAFDANTYQGLNQLKAADVFFGIGGNG